MPQRGFCIAPPRWLKEKTFSISSKNFSHGKDDGLTGCSTTVVRLRGFGAERTAGKTVLIGKQTRHLQYLASHQNPTVQETSSFCLILPLFVATESVLSRYLAIIGMSVLPDCAPPKAGLVPGGRTACYTNGVPPHLPFGLSPVSLCLALCCGLGGLRSAGNTHSLCFPRLELSCFPFFLLFFFLASCSTASGCGGSSEGSPRKDMSLYCGRGGSAPGRVEPPVFGHGCWVKLHPNTGVGPGEANSTGAPQARSLAALEALPRQVKK